MEDPWFHQDFKHPQANNDIDVGLLDDVESAFFTSELACLGTFNIISRSPGFSVSGMFKDNVVKQEKELRFMSTESTSSITSKLEEIETLFRFSCKNSKDCKVKLQESEEGQKGHLCIDAEIFEVTPSLLVVHLRRTEGDTLAYSKFSIQELRPGLKDIVSKWEGDHSVD